MFIMQANIHVNNFCQLVYAEICSTEKGNVWYVMCIQLALIPIYIQTTMISVPNLWMKYTMYTVTLEIFGW